MELASQDQIAKLAFSFGSGPPRKDASQRTSIARPATPTPARATTTPYSKAQHGCKCGHCRVCLQNAEWDAKFNQKFGESMKDYYSGLRLTRRASWWSEL